VRKAEKKKTLAAGYREMKKQLTNDQHGKRSRERYINTHSDHDALSGRGIKNVVLEGLL